MHIIQQTYNRMSVKYFMSLNFRLFAILYVALFYVLSVIVRCISFYRKFARLSANLSSIAQRKCLCEYVMALLFFVIAVLLRA